MFFITQAPVLVTLLVDVGKTTFAVNCIESKLAPARLDRSVKNSPPPRTARNVKKEFPRRGFNSTTILTPNFINKQTRFAML